MQVKLHQPVEGRDAGETIEVDDKRGEWLISQGYASKPRARRDLSDVTSVAAEIDPTLAANREGPDEDTDGVQTQETPATPADGAAAQQDRTGPASGVKAPEGDATPAAKTPEQLAAETQAAAREQAIKDAAKTDEKNAEGSVATVPVDAEVAKAQAKAAKTREKAAEAGAPKVDVGNETGATFGDGSGATADVETARGMTPTGRPEVEDETAGDE